MLTLNKIKYKGNSVAIDAHKTLVYIDIQWSHPCSIPRNFCKK